MALTARKIKYSLSSLMPKSKCKLHALPAEELLRLVNDADKSSHLTHKCCGTLPLRGSSWKRRLVILANSALYVYEEVTSQSPKACVCLRGYNAVRRVPAEKSCQWGFVIACDEDSGRQEVFGCASDLERSRWMKKVKDALYKANNVQPRKLSLAEQLASDLKDSATGESESVDESEYRLLEEPVFEVKDATVKRRNNDQHRLQSADVRLSDTVFTDDDSDDDDDDDDDGYSFGGRRRRCLTDDEKDDDDEVLSYEVGIWCRLQRQGAIKRRREAASSVTMAVGKDAERGEHPRRIIH